MSGSSFLSFICNPEVPSDLMQIEELQGYLQAYVPNYELIICIHTKSKIREDSRGLVQKYDNMAIYEINTGNRDSLFTAGIEIALGDWVIQLSEDYLLTTKALLSQLEIGEFDYLQIVPSRRSWRDKAITKCANVILDAGIITLMPTSRAMSRRSLYSWNNRKMRDKVFRIAPSLEKSLGCAVASDTQSKYYRQRFLRISLRTLINSSAKPLRFISVLSWFGALISLAASFYVFGASLFSEVVPGWTTTNLQISLMSFLILTVLGFVSEYIYQLISTFVSQPAYSLINEDLSGKFGFKDRKNLIVSKSND